MKTFAHVLEAQTEFKKWKASLFGANLTFFSYLLSQLSEKGKIPPGNMAKFKSGTKRPVEELGKCLRIDGCGCCELHVGILVNSDWHHVYFETHTRQRTLELATVVDCDYLSSDFDISEIEKPDAIDFSAISDHILYSIIDKYRISDLATRRA
jgi:hypothetical protein